jgi:hypothetical protein
MYLYQKRLLSLESEFEEIRKKIQALPGVLSGNDIKNQLAVCTESIRLIKEQTAFYIKLGRNYDLLRLVEDILDAVRAEDPEMEDRIFDKVDLIWNEVQDGDGIGEEEDVQGDKPGLC